MEQDLTRKNKVIGYRTCYHHECFYSDPSAGVDRKKIKIPSPLSKMLRPEASDSCPPPIYRPICLRQGTRYAAFPFREPPRSRCIHREPVNRPGGMVTRKRPQKERKKTAYRIQ